MERETRRRKISERGSDRLAIITGRLEEPSPSPFNSNFSSDLSNSPSHNRTQSDPASAANFAFQDIHPPFQNSHSQDALHQIEETQKSTNQNKSQCATVSANNPSQTSNNNSQTSQKSNPILNFTLKDINSSVISSENTRLFCSIMIALLVVISYANIPHHIVKSKSIISSKPLYVLLATDMMIIALRLRVAVQIRRRRKKGKEDDGIKSRLHEEVERSDQLSDALKLMEWGLVMYQIVRALFIDCSFYTVIVVSGFSFI